MTHSRIAFLLAVVAISNLALAQEAEVPTKETPVDLHVQGEYDGKLRSGNRWGAHVIARGQGQFWVIGYRGGLPGAGWRGEAGERHPGKLDKGVVHVDAGNFRLEADGKQLRVFRQDGNPVGELSKANRKSPTLGKKAPEQAIRLFDGSSVDPWEKAELVEKRFLGATNCFTKENFADHTLHLEFRTPFQPEKKGQSRGNSGVYIQRRYEIQVLDSFGLDGKDNECGGIYQIAKPKVNMCFPPLSWQTYDIDFVAARFDAEGKKTKNARITVRHNGVVIHENLELPHATPGQQKEGPMPGPLFLQDHSSPVVYRNIWVLPK